MSYHSDTLAFKKAELLAVLQTIDESFSFDVTSSYKNTFFKHDVFNGFEVACLISEYDPNKLTINLTRSTTWRNENPKFVEALNLVMSADIGESGFWKQDDANFYECEYLIKNEDLKTYLASKKIFIESFNDDLPITHPIAENQPLDQNKLQQKSEQLSNYSKPQHDYKFYLFKKPLLTFREAACIMTGYDPQYVDQCQNDTNFNQNFSDYLGAFEYLDSCIDAQLLPYDSYNNKLEATSFKQFLANEKTFIDGFNDNLSPQELIGCGHPTIQQTEPNIENLKGEIVRLTELIAKKDSEAFEEMLNKLAAEKKVTELQERIKQLEAEQPITQDNKPDLLALILDETQTDRYAPDLAYSIKLWLDAYINNPKVDSHNNKANTWIKKNTPYSGEQDDTPTRRIREIATPFKDLHQSRKRLLENR